MKIVFHYLVLLAGVFILTGAFVGYLTWLDAHDKAVEKAADGYKSCLMTRYHMTPEEYVAEYGEYAACP